MSRASAVVKIGERKKRPDVWMYALSPSANATPPQTLNACFKVAVVEA
jgi:hypothetical protein